MLPSASVKFDFDICSLKTDLINSVETFEIGDELSSIVDRYITSRVGGTIFEGNSSIVDEIKTFVSGQAQTVAHDIREHITDLINRVDCNRRMDTMEIGQDGSQRLLQSKRSFGHLVDQLVNFGCDNIYCVVSANAGFDLTRMEVGFDVAVHVEKLVDGSIFQSALDNVFEGLGPFKAVFGVAENIVADVSDLINALEVKALFQISFSVGAKVDVIVTEFFNDLFSNAAPNVTGFLRINTLAASMVAEVDDLSLELFPGLINTSEALIRLKLGVELLEPVEFMLDSSYIDQNGTSFNEAVRGRFNFETYGTLAASLPFSTTLNNITQRFQVLFEDDNLFDSAEVLVSLDYDACRFLDVFQQLLGKLGAVTVSPQYIVGPALLSASDLLDSLDTLFPNVGRFLTGVLEGEWTELCMPELLLCTFFFAKWDLGGRGDWKGGGVLHVH
jgi:hypothetical protein